MLRKIKIWFAPLRNRFLTGFGVLVLCGIIVMLSCLNLHAQEETVGKIEVTVFPKESVLDSQKKVRYGLLDFTDVPAGILKKDGKYYVFGGDNKVIVRLVGDSFDTLKPDPKDKDGRAIPVFEPSYREDAFDKDYVAGTIYYDSATNHLLLFYHGEYHYPDLPEFRMYSSIGMAVSSDLGKTFKRIGQIISSYPSREENLAAGDINKIANIEISGGSLLVKDGFFYIHYSDYLDPQKVPRIALARAEIKEVLKEAQKGRTGTWGKYFKGNFTEPGIGGRFTPLLEPLDEWGDIYPHVAYNSYLKKYLMVYMAGLTGIPLRASDDGIKWDEPISLVAGGDYPWGPQYADIGGAYYPQIVGVGDNPSLLGQEFYVYYNFYPGDSFNTGEYQKAAWVRHKVKVK